MLLYPRLLPPISTLQDQWRPWRGEHLVGRLERSHIHWGTTKPPCRRR